MPLSELLLTCAAALGFSTILLVSVLWSLQPRYRRGRSSFLDRLIDPFASSARTPIRHDEDSSPQFPTPDGNAASDGSDFDVADGILADDAKDLSTPRATVRPGHRAPQHA